MRDLSFRNHMLLLALLPASLVAIVLSLVYITWNYQEVEVALKDRGRAIARQLGTASEYSIFSGSRDTLRSLAEAAQKGDQEVMSVAILDERGQLLTRVGDGSVPLFELNGQEQIVARDDRFLLLIPIARTVVPLDDPYSLGGVPVVVAKPIAGYVILEISRQRLAEVRNTQTFIGIDIAIVGLLLGVWLAMRMSQNITRPLGHIIDVVERIGRGDLHVRVGPIGSRIFHSLSQNINAMAERVTSSQENLQQRIDAATEEIRARKEEAEMLARIDVLTGIPNRRAFMQLAEQEILRAQRYGTLLTVVLLDLDGFKLVNDTYGHAAGDQVLINHSKLIVDALREVDFAARLGGEEFAIMMPGTPLADSLAAVERIRARLEASLVQVGNASIKCTASFGVAEYMGNDADVDVLLARADGALYLAKARGRNRVETPPQQTIEGV